MYQMLVSWTKRHPGTLMLWSSIPQNIDPKHETPRAHEWAVTQDKSLSLLVLFLQLHEGLLTDPLSLACCVHFEQCKWATLLCTQWGTVCGFRSAFLSVTYSQSHSAGRSKDQSLSFTCSSSFPGLRTMPEIKRVLNKRLSNYQNF